MHLNGLILSLQIVTANVTTDATRRLDITDTSVDQEVRVNQYSAACTSHYPRIRISKSFYPLPSFLLFLFVEVLINISIPQMFIFTHY